MRRNSTTARHRRRQRTRILGVTIAALGIGANITTAANISWNNPIGGNYNSGSNWLGDVVPTSNDFAYYELDSTYTVTVGALSPGNTFAGTFQQFDRGNVTFDANGGTYNSAGPFGYGFVQMIPPAGSAVTVRLINGTIFGDSLAMIGDSGTGTFIIDGSTLDLRQTPDYATTPRLNIGALGGGAGTVSIINGGHLIMDFAGSIPEIVGNGAAGNLIVSGPGSSLTANMQLAAGSFTGVTGTITIANGGLVSSKRGNSTTFTSGSVGYGPTATATGFATVTDPGSRWVQDGTMVVATGGRGTFNILNGGTVSSVGGAVARNAGSAGTVILSGSGSKWSLSGSLAMGGAINANGGNATLTVNNGAELAVAQTLRVRGTGTILYNGGTLTAGFLDVLTNGRVLLASGGDKTLRCNTLALSASGANGGTIDLSDNDLHVKGGTSYNDVISQIRNARNGGAWNQPGLTSSRALAGSVHNSTLGTLTGDEFLLTGNTAFNGSAVAGADVLVKYTYYGDTDFNGVLDFDDYSRTDNGFNNNRAGWFNGDFDYNGVVDFDDYSLIDQAFNTQSGTLRRVMSYLEGSDRGDVGMDAPSLQLVLDHLAQFGEPYAAGFLNSVPEPSAVVIIATFSSLACRRRRR